MITCKQLTELVTAQLEGQLSLTDRLRFQAHLGLCRHCRKYLRQMRITLKTLGKLPDLELSPQVEQELMARFADWKQTR